MVTQGGGPPEHQAVAEQHRRHIYVRIRPGIDEDIWEWWQRQPEKDRSHVLRSVIREHIRQQTDS